MKGEKILDSMSSHISAITVLIPRLNPSETVDLGARVRALHARMESTDDLIATLLKIEAKEIPLVGVGVQGEYYQALVTTCERGTFDVKAFKEFDPKLYNQFLRIGTVQSLRYKLY